MKIHKGNVFVQIFFESLKKSWSRCTNRLLILINAYYCFKKIYSCWVQNSVAAVQNCNEKCYLFCRVFEINFSVKLFGSGLFTFSVSCLFIRLELLRNPKGSYKGYQNWIVLQGSKNVEKFQKNGSVNRYLFKYVKYRL